MLKISDKYADEDRTIEIFGLKFHWPFPIVFMVHSSAAMVFGYQAYGDDRPVVGFIHDIFEGISELHYQFRYRFVKSDKYHVIYTDLGYGYHCSDERILHGAMKCLCEYVESGKHGGEKGLQEHISEMRRAPDEHGICERNANSDSSALEIYRWWKYQLPQDEKDQEALLERAYDDDPLLTEPTDDGMHRIVIKTSGEEQMEVRERYRETEDRINEDKQRHLHRLMDIRRSLWI